MPTLSIAQISLEVWGAAFCFICGLIVFLARKGETKKSLYLMLALFTETVQLISDAVALFYRGNVSNLGFYAVRGSNFLVFLSNFLIGCFLTLYIASSIDGITKVQRKKWVGGILSISTIGMVLLVLSQFGNWYYYFDQQNIYHRTNLYWINMGIALFVIVAASSMLLRFRKQINKVSFIVLLLYMIFPLVVGIIQIFFYGISLTNIANAVVMLLIFVAHEVEKSTRIIEQEKIVTNQKIELADTKVNLMISQIQPHFVSNTLLTIQGLYHEDTKKADKVMNSFVRYLQQSFSELSNSKPISIEKDLEHTKNYTNITNARWDDISFEYDIKCTDFVVPPVTVQPIVENAVRHGILPLEGGGVVKISTYDDNESYYIKVEDNGVGFDESKPKPANYNDRKHIGLSNVVDRVKIMCGGNVEISSKANQGTTITISIPKSKKQ